MPGETSQNRGLMVRNSHGDSGARPKHGGSQSVFIAPDSLPVGG